MPPKRSIAKRTVAAIGSSDGKRSGSDPGSFQLPPFREDRPSLWFKQAEGQMLMRNITDDFFKVVLVQAALSYAQQDSVARILEADPLPPNAYQLLKAELLRLHEKSAWGRLAELFALPALGGQTGTELLASMERLRPADPDLWFRYQFFIRLPADLQQSLAEDKGTVEQLAARVDERLRKVPKGAAATIAAAATGEDVVAAVAQPARSSFKKRKFEDRKRKRSDGGNGGNSAAKRRPDRPDRPQPWLEVGLCYYHYTFGSKADRCEKPCARHSGN
jgi:hypothetical protein